jgi:hypothetical protein
MVSFSSIRRKLHTAGSFSRRQWRSFLQAWFLLLFVDLGLRTLPFRRVQEWLGRGEAAGEVEDRVQAGEIIRRTREMVDLAIRYSPYRMTCLRRSMTLQRLLVLQEIHTVLRFGARREDGALKAHAWLEYQGIPIGEPEALDERFAPLVGFSPNNISNS